MTDVDTVPQTRANAHPFRRSFAVAAVAIVAALIALVATLGSPESPEGLGYALGRLSVPLLIGAAVTGLIARSSRRTWPLWRYVLWVLGLALLLMFFSALGSASEDIRQQS